MQRDTLALNEERSGEHEGVVFAARATHPRTPSQAVFRTGTDSPVSSDSSADRLLHEWTAASAATRSPSARTRRLPGTTSRPAMRLLAPPPMTSAGAGEVLQGLQRPLRPSVPVESNPQDHEHEATEHQGLLHIAEEKINRPAGEEQKKDRLADHVPTDRKKAPASGRRKLVADGAQPVELVEHQPDDGADMLVRVEAEPAGRYPRSSGPSFRSRRRRCRARSRASRRASCSRRTGGSRSHTESPGCVACRGFVVGRRQALSHPTTSNRRLGQGLAPSHHEPATNQRDSV